MLSDVFDEQSKRNCAEEKCRLAAERLLRTEFSLDILTYTYAATSIALWTVYLPICLHV